MKSLKISILFLGLFLNTAAFAQQLEAGFEIVYSVDRVVGVFHESTVDFNFDREKLTESYFNIEIAVASLDTEMEARDKEILKKKYFHAEKYPHMTFVSERVYQEGIGYFLEGNLTIKDETKKLKLPLELAIGEEGLKSLATQFVIDRRDYGVGKSHFLLEDDVTIRIKLTL